MEIVTSVAVKSDSLQPRSGVFLLHACVITHSTKSVVLESEQNILKRKLQTGEQFLQHEKMFR
jgi:hypothetical protein